ncbi:hypothetical protein VOI32_07770 [Paraburkholderia caribensis]|uniref:Uncharacterized protein n=1 Tax=Paraburkholderia caribensis TaxID=75105 RepID=A0ABV0DUX9_9BURK|nr:hypothetical protein [Paraburkholderia caribensis]MCO4876329.1 hypothetical protein [Paraburkholderia caribensis]
MRIVGGNWHVSEPKAQQEADIHGEGSTDPAVVVNAITHHASSGRSNNCRDKAITGTPASEEIFDAGIDVPEFALPPEPARIQPDSGQRKHPHSSLIPRRYDADRSLVQSVITDPKTFLFSSDAFV